MSDYKMNIYGQIRLSDYSSIHDYMGIIGPLDNRSQSRRCKSIM